MDEADVRAFIQSEYPRLVAAVTLVSGSRAAAEDAVQEAVLRAWERLDRGDTIESLGAWVTRVAVNLARSRWRRLLAEQRATDRLRSPFPQTEFDLDARADLRRAIRRLPRLQREVTIFHYYLGYDVSEIAHMLGVTRGTVKTSLHRARRALARRLEHEHSQEESHLGP